MRYPIARLAVAGGLTVLTCASCGQSGPAPISDGSYAFLNSAQATDAAGGGQPKVATLQVSGKIVTVTAGNATARGTIGATTAAAVLCPPKGKGTPLELDKALTVGTITLTSPAIFGPCPEVAPKRVTLIDLDSFETNQTPFGYTRWIAFCDTKDPDC